MSGGGGGFGGRGFASRGHVRHGSEGSRRPNLHANRHDSRTSHRSRGGSTDPRSNVTNPRTDRPKSQSGASNFHNDGVGPPSSRGNFNVSRGGSRHSSQGSDGNWSNNNWSGNKWSEDNWSGNKWNNNNPGNNWCNNSGNNNWGGNNWQDNNSGNNWSPRGIGHQRGFPSWRGGCPPRFNTPPPFFPPQGQNPFLPFAFPPPLASNYVPPPLINYPPIVDPEPQISPTLSKPRKSQNPEKLPKPEQTQKQTPHLGSEEERQQKITEAADKLKRKLSTITKVPKDIWENENENEDEADSSKFPSQDCDHEPRMANRGIPELKHDPPELNLTLNDLRDIGRVDHDHTTRTSQPEDVSLDDQEVTILEHNPVEKIPEATIDIDIWPEDNPDRNESEKMENAMQEENKTPETIVDNPGPLGDNFTNNYNNETETKQASDERGREEAKIFSSNEENTKNVISEDLIIEEQINDPNIDDKNENTLIPETEVSEDTASVEITGSKEINNEIFSEFVENSQIGEEKEQSGFEFGEFKNRTTISEENIRESIESVSSPSKETVNTCTEQFKVDAMRGDKINENNDKINEFQETEEITNNETDSMAREETTEVSNETKVSEGSHNKSETREESAKTIVDELIKESLEKMTNDSDNIASVKNSSGDKTETLESEVETANVATKHDTIDKLQEEDSSIIQNANGNKISSENVIEETTTNADFLIKEQKNTTNDTKDEKFGDEVNEEIEMKKIDEIEKEKSREMRKIDSFDTDITEKKDTNKIWSSKKDNFPNAEETSTTTSIEESQPENQMIEKSTELSNDDKKSEDNQDFQKDNHENLRNSKNEFPKEEIAKSPKTDERKKIVRKMQQEDLISKNRSASSGDSNVRTCNENFYPNDSQSGLDSGLSNKRGSTSSYLTKTNYGISKRNNDEILPSFKFDPKQPPPKITNIQDKAEPQLPPAFDPRLSLHERSVLLSSSIPMNQDFSMTHGYPPCTMSNLVTNVAPMSYVVPTALPPPSMVSTSNIPPPPICIPDHYPPIISLPNVPIVPPIVLPNDLLMQRPPMLNALPPPPPPPIKSNLDMDAELEDMQEAMEFAKQFMNMNESSEKTRDIFDNDDSNDSDFFHMPTLPDLPPIELPPMPPVESPNVMEKNLSPQSSCTERTKKVSSKNTRQEVVTYGPTPMPDDYRQNLDQVDAIEKNVGISDEQLRPKVVFNLNSKIKKIGKHDEWHQQNHRDDETTIVVNASTTISNPEVTKNRKNKTVASKQFLLGPISGTTKETSRFTNGHEERKKYNGKMELNNPSTLQSNVKKTEETKSQLNTKREIVKPRTLTHDNKIESSTKRSNREIPKKKSDDSRTPESTWKNRVIGRFLKMSQNDIRNMLNNASLRKFDIAMQHLVKERRSSLSLELRSNEEEKMKESEICYNREEFMDQLSAMLDPGATVDVCNLPTQFIQHLSEVLQLDTMSEFDSLVTASDTMTDVSQSEQQSSPRPETKRLPSEAREIPHVKEVDEEQQVDRRKKRIKERKPDSSIVERIPVSSTKKGNTIPEKIKLESQMVEIPKADNSATGNLSDQRVPKPRLKKRLLRRTITDQRTNTVDKNLSMENDQSSLNMADLDDIFSAGIARAKKQTVEVPTLRGSSKREDERRNEKVIEEKNAATIDKDPCIARVERAVVELDEIFTAGIARAKLASKKAAEVSETKEAQNGENDEDGDDERSWNRNDLRFNLDMHRLRHKSSSSSRHSSKADKWTRRKNCEEPATFRNLTKEEWEAKYGESSYVTYQREYRAMEALRAQKSQQRFLAGAKEDISPATESNEPPSAKSRLGEPVAGITDFDDTWNISDDRLRNINDATNYQMTFNRHSDDSSSTTSTSSDSSDKEDNEATPSVTKLLKVIKEREKIAKQKTLNEEIRDEVTAEIERKRRERDKVRKKHKIKTKKSSHHHRRKKEKKDKLRDRKRRERRRKKRKSRHSDDEDSMENTENDEEDEECVSSPSQGRSSQRLLNENEIKKEVVIKEEPEMEATLISEKKLKKNSMNVKTLDDSRPASTASSSSVPSIITSSVNLANSSTTAHQPKTKAQLKQMPVEVTKKISIPPKADAETTKESRISQDADQSIDKHSSSSISKALTTSGTPENPPISMDAIPARESSTPGSDVSSKSNSKKLDIKTYKERARQRQDRENEKIRLITENPSSLTQNLLNISLTRKNETGESEEPVKKKLADPRLTKNNVITIIPINVDTKAIVSTISITDISSSSLSIPALTGNSNIEDKVSLANIPRKKIVRRPNAAVDQTSVEKQSTLNDSPIDVGKFAHIKSEGRKELKLREKLKRGRSKSNSDSLDINSIQSNQPTRLKRPPKNLVDIIDTRETISLNNELKISKVPLSKNVEDSKKLLDSTKNLEEFESSIKISNIGENFETSIIDSPNLDSHIPENLEASINLDALKNLNETKILAHSDNSKTLDTSQICKNMETTIIPDDLKTGNALKNLTKSKSLDMTSFADNLKNFESTKVLEKSKSVDFTKIVDCSGTSRATETLNNVEYSGNPKSENDFLTTDEMATTADNSEILDSREAAEDPEFLDKEVTMTSNEPEALDASPKHSPREELPETKDLLPLSKNISTIVESENSSISLELPMEELPFLSLVAANPSNGPETMDYSSDSGPFKGFTDEAIIRRDRVLTEAEIIEDSALEAFETVPLNFVADEEESTRENLDMDELTRPEVVDTLEVPLPYIQEEFTKTSDEIETSLPDPFGDTVFSISNDIVQVPVAIDMEPVENLGKNEASKKISEPEESIAVSTPVTPVIENSSSTDDFFINNVDPPENVPFPLLESQACSTEPKESSFARFSLAKEKIDETSEKEKTTMDKNDAREIVETSLPKEFSINKDTTETENSNIEEPSRDDETLRKGDTSLHKSVDRIVEDNSSNGYPEPPEITENVSNKTEPLFKNSENESIENNLSVVPRDERTNKEIEKSLNCDKRSIEPETKDSHHHSKTKDHGHSRSKKKSSRHHNHSSKSTKKTTLTEKLVEDAISANVVKLVAKPTSKDSVMARMIEIDVEIHKLMNEKMTLYKMLESGDFSSHENEDSITNKTTIEESKIVNDNKDKIDDGLPKNVLASRLARNISTATVTPKTQEETTKKLETKKFNSEPDERTKKRKKSPQRNNRSRERDVESYEDRKNAENSKIRRTRITVSEESSRNVTSRFSREKSTSSLDLDQREEKNRKRSNKSLSRQSTKRQNEDSSKEEDLLDVLYDNSDPTLKLLENDSSKHERSKKKLKSFVETPSIDEPVKKSKIERNRSEDVCHPGKKMIPKTIIYSDESTLESQDSEISRSDDKLGKQETGSLTGLTLLEESFKREIAQHRRVKNLERRRNKNRQLRRGIRDPTILTANEAQTGLINLLNRKKSQKKMISSSAGLRKNVKVWKHVSSVIDAVAKNRVDELYNNETPDSPSDVETLRKVEGDRSRKEREEKEEETKEIVKENISSKSLKQSTDKIDNEDHADKPEVGTTTNSLQCLSSKEKEDPVKSLIDDEAETRVCDLMESEKTEGSFLSNGNENSRKSLEAPETGMAEEIERKTRSPIIDDGDMTDEETMESKENRENYDKGEHMNIDNSEISTKLPSASLEYAEASGKDSFEKNVRTEQERDQRMNKSTNWNAERFEEDDYDTEKIPRSRSRSSPRSKDRGKSRNVTRKDKRTQERDNQDSSPKRDNEHYPDTNKASRRPRSSTYRGTKRREKSDSRTRRSSKQSEENGKNGRSKKREHERSNSRGLSPYDNEPLKKRSNSHGSSSPPLSSMNDEQSRRRGKKRKRRAEMTLEEMANCRVDLIDCKYTYLSPTMHPKILKKLGISRINRYVEPIKLLENLPTLDCARETEVSSPPTLSKVSEIIEHPEDENIDDNDDDEIPKLFEISEAKIPTEDQVEKKKKVQSTMECNFVKENVDEDDEDDDNIQIFKVVDETLTNVEQSNDEDEIESIEEITRDPPDDGAGKNESRKEVITFEEDDDTIEEYEVIDEVTDENEDIDTSEETNNDVEVIDKKASVFSSTEETVEPEKSTIIQDDDDDDDEMEPRRTRYTVHKGPILDIKVLDDSFLAASEDGAIYRYSQTSNGILNIYKGHEAAVTCIYVLEMPGKRWNLYSGSLDGTFRCYDITTGIQDRPANIGSPVQCMDQGWGIIYVGTKCGHISRYSIKSGGLKGDKLEFSDKSVLALKASAEGPRRVLIVASRNQPITIRDAHNGLFLRTICGYKNHTVYSLMRERNLVYCGTSSTSIPVYDFTNGEQVTQYNAGVGIVCMRLYRQILFAGCYDGNIYVFDTKESKLLCSIPGPGNMLLSMEVVDDEIIAGSKNRQLHLWRMPKTVRALLAERT